MTTINHYGTQLTKAVKTDIQAQNKKTYGLNFPFGKNTRRGYFAKEAGLELIKSNLIQLLSTVPGERVMLPNYGLDLRNFLFEPLDSITFGEMKSLILSTLASYAPYVRVVGLRIVESDKINYSGIPGIVISLTVKVLDGTGQTIDLSVNLGE